LKADNCDNYEICAHLKRCSIETNFGNDLKTKPFIHNISAHLAPKEFYVDSDGSIVSSLTSKFSDILNYQGNIKTNLLINFPMENSKNIFILGMMAAMMAAKAMAARDVLKMFSDDD